MDLTGTGVESWIGLSEETTYGDGCAGVEDYLHFVSEGFAQDTGQREVDRSVGVPLPSNVSDRAPVNRGSFQTEWYLEGLETWWKYAFGNHHDTVADTAGQTYHNTFSSALRYLPEFAKAADPTHTSLTAHVARGHQSAAGRCYRYTGVIPTRFGLVYDQNGGLMNGECLFYDQTVPASPPSAPASYKTQYLSSPTRAALGIHDYDAADVSAITFASFRLDVNLGTEQMFPLGLNGGTDYPLPRTPHRSRGIEVTGEFVAFDVCDSQQFGGLTLRQRMERETHNFIRLTVLGPVKPGLNDHGGRVANVLSLYGARLIDVGPAVENMGHVMRRVKFQGMIADNSATYDYAFIYLVTKNTVGAFGDYSLAE